MESATLDELTRTPYVNVLTYPTISLTEAGKRVRQLRSLGVDEVIFQGHSKIGKLGVLGIGTVGVVVEARIRGEVLALKIRRSDANRPNMDDEVKMANLANRVGVGPPVYDHSKDFIVMKLLSCVELDEWLGGLKGRGSRSEVRSIVHSLLNQCRKLDIMGIDHGQLSNLRKHAVISEGVPWIIDFESAGMGRKPKNVTTATQYLLVGGRISPRMRRALGIRGTSGVLEVITQYKRDPSDYSYSKMLEALKLVPT